MEECVGEVESAMEKSGRAQRALNEGLRASRRRGKRASFRRGAARLFAELK